ncbi:MULTISPECIES: RNA polymerase sigma factor [Microbacterium]|nr:MULTISPECIES: RNA polymerase sigma factor [Microbacterium]
MSDSGTPEPGSSEWLRMIAPELLAFFRRRVRVDEDAADLLSECLLTAWRRRAAIPVGDEQARMWVYGVAGNTVRNWARSNQRHHRLADRLRQQLRIASVPPQLDEVRAAISRLPTDQAELIRLVHWEGFSVIDAATVLGVSESTARGRYQRARHTLSDDPTLNALRPAAAKADPLRDAR